jgi:hypothetical protein
MEKVWALTLGLGRLGLQRPTAYLLGWQAFLPPLKIGFLNSRCLPWTWQQELDHPFNRVETACLAHPDPQAIGHVVGGVQLLPIDSFMEPDGALRQEPPAGDPDLASFGANGAPGFRSARSEPDHLVIRLRSPGEENLFPSGSCSLGGLRWRSDKFMSLFPEPCLCHRQQPTVHFSGFHHQCLNLECNTWWQLGPRRPFSCLCVRTVIHKGFPDCRKTFLDIQCRRVALNLEDLDCPGPSLEALPDLSPEVLVISHPNAPSFF